MESVDHYLREILAAIAPLPAAETALADCAGTVLAEDVSARWPLPGFDNSAMDGYAVRAADVAGASAEAPVTLPVDGEVPAGDTGQRAITPGRCLRIMTGAMVPGGADAVVPVEWTDGGTQTVTIRQPAVTGNSIRLAGGDAKPGDLLLTAGTFLGPAQVAVLAAAGLGKVLTHRRPTVAVLSTGNELAEPGEPLIPGQIWESNSYMLAAAARAAGCEALRHPPLPDEADAVLAALDRAASESDLVITSAGVSMGGEHDVVKAALSRLGTVTFRKVAMQPGMPQGFGVIGPSSTPIFTLPGNPVSALVSFRVFVLPALRALQNLPAQRTVPATAVLAARVGSPAGKRSFLRGTLDRSAGVVTALTGQGSHHIASAARADTLIVVPEDVTSLDAGAVVEVTDL